MGQCTLTLRNTGFHHNDNAPNDFDYMAKEFIRDLRVAGHTVDSATLTREGAAGEENLLLVESGDNFPEYGAFWDGLLKGLLNQVSISGTKFIKHPKFKEAVHCLVIVAKDCTTAPGNIDDILYDQVENLINRIIDQQQLSGPVEVGAVGAPRVKRIRTREQVIEEIRNQGGDPSKFNPLILSLLMYLPSIIEFIRTMLGK